MCTVRRQHFTRTLEVLDKKQTWSIGGRRESIVIAPSRQGLEFTSRIYNLENGGTVGHDLPFDTSITGRDEYATALPVDVEDTPANVEHGGGRCRAAANQLYSRRQIRFFPFGHTCRIGPEANKGKQCLGIVRLFSRASPPLHRQQQWAVRRRCSTQSTNADPAHL